MDTLRHKGTEFHVGCGGEVVKRVCIKCGEKQERNLLKKIFGQGPLLMKNSDLEETKRKAHKIRIREGRDIFKE